LTPSGAGGGGGGGVKKEGSPSPSGSCKLEREGKETAATPKLILCSVGSGSLDRGNRDIRKENVEGGGRRTGLGSTTGVGRKKKKEAVRSYRIQPRAVAVVCVLIKKIKDKKRRRENRLTKSAEVLLEERGEIHSLPPSR